MSREEDGDLIPTGMFVEPESFKLPQPEATEVTYQTIGGKSIYVNLVGSSPLYGHILTNACMFVANYLEENAASLVRGKTVLEFGSGGALPSLLCAEFGATMVVATDYPDADLISNIEANIEENSLTANCKTVGFIWGNDTTGITHLLEGSGQSTFDVIILSDVIFNHTEHYKLLKSCKELVTPGTGKILVTFSPHRPRLLKEDLDFFAKSQEDPYEFEPEFVEMKHYSPLFKDDKDESTKELRSRVYFYVLHTPEA
ncbi:DEKNAAC104567 [Brettanomyces naardenensis]|uniref:DEKNAAC104567 n=1 Tax=Brettanomyces naardenensis TaxID=13370 RepID=A0A448YRG9_BRENA|nr:DEKNAAC104567 [Brettanomyces naardenensis]